MEKITLNYSASGQKLKPLYSLKKFASDTVNYVVAVFDLDESWAFDSVRAVWKTENACISTVLDQDGACTVPQEVLQKKAKVEVNLVGSDVEENQLTERLTTYPVQAFIVDRDVPICGSETAEITPSQFEQFVQIVTAEVAKIRDVDRVELNDDYTITFYYSDGTESPKIGPIRGETGADGNGIQSITKIGSEGRIDTYRITYTNGGHFDFNVTNGEKGDRGEQGETGNGIDRIEKTGTVGSVDTYTIYFTDGTTTTFDVTDGEVTNAVLDEATIVQTNTDNVPYLFRPSGGDVRTGRKEFDTIVGGTVAWNQLANIGGTETISGITFTKDNGSYVLSGTANGLASKVWMTTTNVYEGHKYLLTGGVSRNVYCVLTNVSVWNTTERYDYGTGSIARCLGNGTATGYAQVLSGTAVNNVKVTPQLTDLTAMLGTTIADYIYSLETATAGAGVAWFRRYFPKDYYPYDPGTLRSVEGVSAHETVGFNQWDISTDNIGKAILTDGSLGNNSVFNTSDYIRVIPNATYYFHNVAPSANALSFAQYDSDKNFVKTTSISGASGTDASGSAVMEGNTHFIRCARFARQNEPCINLSDPTRNGEYEPYQKHTYPLDSSLTLRGVPKLVDGKLAYDGDIYLPSGDVQRRYGIVDLGTLNWYYTDTASHERFYSAIMSDAKCVTGTVVANAVCHKYQTTTNNLIYTHSADKTIAIDDNGRVQVYDSSYTDVASFKSAMSGVYLVYELATPTTETADPYTNPQIVDPSGTEEYVGSPIPVGHETDYPMTLTDTMPTANGTYTLNLTVANGKRSVSWTNELAVAIAAL